VADSVAEKTQSMKSPHARRTIPHGRHGFRRYTGALVEWGRLATAMARAVPDFLVIGAMRGGSSFLYHYLTQHPMVLPAFRKEVRYFDRSYRQRKHPFLWYRSFFPLRASLRALGRLRKHRCVTGEATPSYLFLETVPPRVLFTVPHVRLIAMLRNPVDRALSHYFLECRRHRELLPLKEALLAEEERVDLLLRNGGGDTEQSRLETMQFSYKSFGVYVDQIKRWRMWFPASQMLILQSEQVFAEPEKAFPRVCRFLDLPEWHPPAVRKIYEGSYPAPEAEIEEAKALLREYFEPHNRRLFEYLGVEWDWPT